MIGKSLLITLVNICCAFSIILCGSKALETTNMFYCLLWWIGVYAILDLHIYLINYIKSFIKLS